MLRKGSSEQLPAGLRHRHPLHAPLRPVGPAAVRRPRRRPVRGHQAGHGRRSSPTTSTPSPRPASASSRAPSSRPTSSSPPPASSCCSSAASQLTVDGAPVDLADRAHLQGDDARGRAQPRARLRLHERLVDAEVATSPATTSAGCSTTCASSGLRQCMPANATASVEPAPLLGLSSGYVQRGATGSPSRVRRSRGRSPELPADYRLLQRGLSTTRRWSSPTRHRPCVRPPRCRTSERQPAGEATSTGMRWSVFSWSRRSAGTRRRHDPTMPPARRLRPRGPPRRTARGCPDCHLGRVGRQVGVPLRVARRPSLRSDQRVLAVVLDPHQGDLADFAAAGAAHRDDDHRQPGLAQRVRFGAARTLVGRDLVAHPFGRARLVLTLDWHGGDASGRYRRSTD